MTTKKKNEPSTVHTTHGAGVGRATAIAISAATREESSEMMLAPF